MNDIANADMAEFWNAATGEKWARYQERMDARLRQFGAAAMDAAGIAAGARIVDVGCGCGGTSFELARRAGPDGRVLGLDISAPMLARARQRAANEKTANLTFTLGDAQTHALEAAAFDLVFSRFGVMFFDDPTAAFANLGAALRPGGRIAFACWRPMADNQWAWLPLEVVGRHVELPAPSPPEAPGPFAFAERSRITGILTEAGFAGAAATSFETKYIVGDDLDEAVAFFGNFAPSSRAIAAADPDAATRANIAGGLREALAPFDTGAGVAMDAAIWVVTADKP